VVLGWFKERFWVVPTVLGVLAGLLAEGLSRIDASVWGDGTKPAFLFAGGPEGARTLLSAIVGSMISFTALVFSITIVVLQLTSGQFSPRVLRTFLRDRFNQVVLGVFVATFVYAMVVLRTVRGTTQVDPFVPQLAVTTAFGFVLASTIVFLFYLNHTAQAIRVATIITGISEECRASLERCHPLDDEREPLPAPLPGSVTVVGSAAPGVLVRIDVGALAAEQGGFTVEVLRAVGEFVPENGPLFRVRGGEPDPARLQRAVHLDEERTLDQDPGFGLRQLVDIALRALSPGVNDPTTAVQVLDQLHDLLRRLATRPLPGQVRRDEGGRCVVLVPAPGFAEYLDLTVTEIRRWGGEDDRIRARVLALLRDVHAAARPEHRDALTRQITAWGGVPAPAAVAADPDPTDVGLRRSGSGGR
jgi:uncharacterized membrane protein